MNKQYEFAKLYYDWIVKCLTEDEKWNSLSYFMLGCELCVRQKELANIKWSQIDFPYVKNIEIVEKKYKNKISYYLPKEITKITKDMISKGHDHKSDTLFKYPTRWYVDEIKKSCGDSRFNGHMIRTLGNILKLTNDLNQ